MSNTLRVVIGLVVIAHGLTHPILSIIPDSQTEGAPVGTFWNKSWLLGEKPFVKSVIYGLSGLAALLLLFAGLSFMGFLVPVAWWRTLWITGAGVSGLLLIAFWHPWFFVGLIIDIVILGLLFLSKFSPY